MSTAPDDAHAGADLAHLVVRRGLDVPAADRDALVGYWARLRGLRAAVDENRLAHHEIALTWTAEDPDAD